MAKLTYLLIPLWFVDWLVHCDGADMFVTSEGGVGREDALVTDYYEAAGCPTTVEAFLRRWGDVIDFTSPAVKRRSPGIRTNLPTLGRGDSGHPSKRLSQYRGFALTCDSKTVVRGGLSHAEPTFPQHANGVAVMRLSALWCANAPWGRRRSGRRRWRLRQRRSRSPPKWPRCCRGAWWRMERWATPRDRRSLSALRCPIRRR